MAIFNEGGPFRGIRNERIYIWIWFFGGDWDFGNFIESGGVMDIQKEREAFEKQPDIAVIFKDLHPTIIWFCEAANRYASSFEGFQKKVIWLNGAWWAWQAAKAQVVAVPHNFASRLKATMENHYDRLNNVLHEEGYNDKIFGQLMGLDFVEEVINEMIEAQE